MTPYHNHYTSIFSSEGSENTAVAVVDGREAASWIYRHLSPYDPDPLFSSDVFAALAEHVLDTVDPIDPVGGSPFTVAMNRMQEVGMSQEEAYAIAIGAGDLLMQSLARSLHMLGIQTHTDIGSFHIGGNHAIYVELELDRAPTLLPKRTRARRL